MKAVNIESLTACIDVIQGWKDCGIDITVKDAFQLEAYTMLRNVLIETERYQKEMDELAEGFKL